MNTRQFTKHLLSDCCGAEVTPWNDEVICVQCGLEQDTDIREAELPESTLMMQLRASTEDIMLRNYIDFEVNELEDESYD